MKRILSILLALCMTVSAMAYSFTGKTFKGTTDINGSELTLTIRFKTSEKASMSYSGKGLRSQSDSNIYWQLSGDVINLVDSTGGISYLMIERDEEDNILLCMQDDYGNYAICLQEVKGAPDTKKKSTGKKKRR